MVIFAKDYLIDTNLFKQTDRFNLTCFVDVLFSVITAAFRFAIRKTHTFLLRALLKRNVNFVVQ